MSAILGNGTVTFGDGTSLSTNPLPAGTLMLFQQTAAPTGWTKQTTHNDKALRVVSGTAGSGGTTAFTSVFVNQAPATGATTLSTTQMPSHAHSLNSLIMIAAQGYSGLGQGVAGGSAYPIVGILGDTGAGTSTGSNGSSGSHTHPGGTVTLNVQYVDLIIASKD